MALQDTTNEAADDDIRTDSDTDLESSFSSASDNNNNNNNNSNNNNNIIIIIIIIIIMIIIIIIRCTLQLYRVMLYRKVNHGQRKQTKEKKKL